MLRTPFCATAYSIFRATLRIVPSPPKPKTKSCQIHNSNCEYPL